ncbi:hypothetical protein AAIB41_13560 [Brucella sp. BE17]
MANPEQAHLSGGKFQAKSIHPVMKMAAHNIVDFNYMCQLGLSMTRG